MATVARTRPVREAGGWLAQNVVVSLKRVMMNSGFFDACAIDQS
jgi:hypothetical protein